MSNLVALVAIGLTIYTFAKKGLKEGMLLFGLCCILAAAAGDISHLTTVGNAIWKIVEGLLGGISLA